MGCEQYEQQVFYPEGGGIRFLQNLPDYMAATLSEDTVPYLL
jgi:hypothetical protein